MRYLRGASGGRQPPTHAADPPGPTLVAGGRGHPRLEEAQSTRWERLEGVRSRPPRASPASFGPRGPVSGIQRWATALVRGTMHPRRGVALEADTLRENAVRTVGAITHPAPHPGLVAGRTRPSDRAVLVC